MKIEIGINPDEDPDLCGELLLRDMNPNDRWGYTTHDLMGSWSEQHKSNANLTILTLLQGCFAKKEGNERVTLAYNYETGVCAYLYWDGDGSIVFDIGGDLLYNGDMKCSYGWEWNPTWVEGYWNE